MEYPISKIPTWLKKEFHSEYVESINQKIPSLKDQIFVVINTTLSPISIADINLFIDARDKVIVTKKVLHSSRDFLNIYKAGLLEAEEIKF